MYKLFKLLGFTTLCEIMLFCSFVKRAKNRASNRVARITLYMSIYGC